MKLRKIIELLLDSEDDTGCTGGLTVVEKRYLNQLKRYYKDLIKAESNAKIVGFNESLQSKREVAANKTWVNWDNIDFSHMSGNKEIIDCEGWEITGDTWKQKFTYSFVDSKKVLPGVYLVIFHNDSDKVAQSTFSI